MKRFVNGIWIKLCKGCPIDSYGIGFQQEQQKYFINLLLANVRQDDSEITVI